MKKADSEGKDAVTWNPRLIDRLVDGELSPEAYRDLLQQFEKHPDGWRVCATAFLESQAWRQAMGNLVTTEAEPSSVSRSLPGSPPVQLSRPRRTRPWSVFGLAASLALAFLAGRLGPHSAPDQPRPADLAIRSGIGAIPGARDNSALHFVNRGILDGQSAIMPQIRQSLGRLGVQVSQQHGYIPLMTEDGTQVIVPFADVKLIPANLQPY